MLTQNNHSRTSVGLTYIYPVISRRAGGVSIGINLNVNNACNWACIYCQVENLKKGGPPPVNIDLLEEELSFFLHEIVHGDFMIREVPPEARQLVDIAFSGNGEPTTAKEFYEVVKRVRKLIEQFGLSGKVILRLITNGSQMQKPNVQSAISLFSEIQGEVWFKFDRAEINDVIQINGIVQPVKRHISNLEICSSLAPTWVQTCWFAVDGLAPSKSVREAYCSVLKPLGNKLCGIHLYGLARPPMQNTTSNLGRLEASQLYDFANEIQEKTGITVTVSP